MSDRWGEWKWLTKIILGIAWGFFLFGVVYTIIFNGTFISTLICTPFLFMITLAAGLFFYLARDEEESIIKRRAPLSGMLVYSIILFVFFWAIYIILLLVFYPAADSLHQSNFLVTCTPFILIMTVMFLLFITYELKKPWKNRLYADPNVLYRQANDGTLNPLGVDEFFEPASVADSERTRILRKAIIALMGLSVALVVLSLPLYDQDSGTFIGGSIELLVLGFKIILPIIMVIMVGLFITYVRMKYRDWNLYLDELEKEGKHLPEQLRDDEDSDFPF